MQPSRLAAVTLTLALVGAACGGTGGSDEVGSGAVVSPTTAPAAFFDRAPFDRALADAEPVELGPGGPGVDRRPAHDADTAAGGAADTPPIRELSPLADLVEPAGDIRFDPLAALPDPGPRPVGLTIDGIEISDAPILPVGVEPNGEMEIPGANDIGWYRWSPTPGQAGSSVLAAHIAFNGRDGVFRNLDDVEVGQRFTVRYDDGTEREFEVTERAQYAKEELPFDRVFSKEGDPTVVLITCGGDFNRGLNSYDDNVVVYADPV